MKEEQLKSGLFSHTQRPHEPKNVNELHKEKARQRGFNARLAVIITENVGTTLRTNNVASENLFPAVRADRHHSLPS